MDKVRMRALKDFTRRILNQIIVGDPNHPNEEGRILEVSEAAAIELEDAGEAERYSHKDQAREEAEYEKRAAAADGGTGPATPPPAAPVDTTRAENRQTSREVRENKTNTSGTGSATRRRATAKGTGKAPGDRGSAPVGGSDTAASTNNGTTSLGGDGVTGTTNAGATAAPDPDAAPTA